jgi:hypothetical protein
MDNLAFLYRHKGDYARSEGLFTQAIANWRATVGEQHPDTLTSMTGLAGLYRTEGRLADADKLYSRVLEVRTGLLGPQHPDTVDAMTSLARVRLLEDRFAEAESLLRSAILNEKQGNAGSWSHYFREGMLGASLEAQTKFGQAEPLLIGGYEGLVERENSIPSDVRPVIREWGELIVHIYEASNRADEAAAWRTKLGTTESSRASSKD